MRRLIALIGILLLSTGLYAGGGHDGEGFNPGHMIFHHLLDDYQWHFATVGNKHISLYLPVIVYSPERGLSIFSSKHLLYNDHYNGYKIERTNLGKPYIVVVDENGNVLDIPVYDFSITRTVFQGILAAILLLIIMISVAKAYSRDPYSPPKSIMQRLLEPVILFIRDEVAKPTIGEKHYKFLPYLLTAFFFILTSNLLGLTPFGFNITGNISTTVTLTMFTFIIIHSNANKEYWKHIFNTPGVPWWLKFGLPIMPIVEVISVFSKHIALAVRLFANIFGGHMSMLSILSMIFIFGSMSVIAGWGISPVVVGLLIFLFFLEILVAFIQAYIFTMLSSLFIGMAVQEHH